jgi:hypothetical protein
MGKLIVVLVVFTYLLSFFVLFGFSHATYRLQRMTGDVITILYLLIFLYSTGFLLVSLLLWGRAYINKDITPQYIWSQKLKKSIWIFLFVIISYYVLTFTIGFFAYSLTPLPPFPCPSGSSDLSKPNPC